MLKSGNKQELSHLPETARLTMKKFILVLRPVCESPIATRTQTLPNTIKAKSTTRMTSCGTWKRQNCHLTNIYSTHRNIWLQSKLKRRNKRLQSNSVKLWTVNIRKHFESFYSNIFILPCTSNFIGSRVKDFVIILLSAHSDWR